MSLAEQFLPLKHNLLSSSLDLFVLHLSLRVNLLHAAFFNKCGNCNYSNHGFPVFIIIIIFKKAVQNSL